MLLFVIRMDHIRFYEPTRGHGLRHDPLGAIVGPRPIGWISTVDRAGVANLAPYAFFNVFNYTPPIVAFSSVGVEDRGSCEPRSSLIGALHFSAHRSCDCRFSMRKNVTVGRCVRSS